MRTFLLSLAVFLLPAAASAHGDRPSFETHDGPYLIDIGYDRIGIRPDEEVVFDFDLFNESGSLSFVPFTYVDVAFTKDGTEVFHERMENKPQYIPTLPFTFAEAGDYTLTVSYGSGDTVIADASFPVPVTAQAGTGGRILNIATYVIAAVLALFALWVIIQSLRGKFRQGMH